MGNNFIGKEVWEKTIEGITILETPIPKKVTKEILNTKDPFSK